MPAVSSGSVLARTASAPNGVANAAALRMIGSIGRWKDRVE
jgi:hypothetical protein